MKKSVMLLVSIAMMMGVSTISSGEEVLRLTNGEWPPYHSKDLKHGGIVSHIVSDIFASKGITVEYGWFPWVRAMVYAETGKWDGCVSWDTLDPEKRKTLYFSEPLYEGQWVFFHVKDVPFDWQNLDDLHDVTIGITIGYEEAYGNAFMEAVRAKKIPVDYAPSDELNFKKLVGKRFQIFPNDKEVGYGMLNKMVRAGELTEEEAQSITHHPIPLVILAQHLVLSKHIARNKELLVLFNEGLEEFKASGKLEEYFENGRHGWYEQKEQP